MRWNLAAALVAVLAVGAACDKRARFRPSQVGASAMEVRQDEAVIRHGRVGVGRFEGEGTYVLVDAVNHLSTDVDLALEGDLLGADGEVLGPLNRDSLRVPAGAQRTFALVHHRGLVPDATGADVRIAHVQLAHHPLPLHLEDANVYRDGDRVVVAANVVNETDRELIVLVIAGFYGGDGAIMNRPFSAIRIPPEMKKPARFVGPDGSASGYLFLGEQIY